MELLSSKDARSLHLHYPELGPDDLAKARATVAGLPPLSGKQWQRIARRLGLVVTGDGR
jgi:hypothetical protein